MVVCLAHGGVHRHPGAETTTRAASLILGRIDKWQRAPCGIQRTSWTAVQALVKETAWSLPGSTREVHDARIFDRGVL